MHTRLYHHIKNLLLPCLVFSMAVGFLSAIFVTAFKLAAETVIHLSTTIYGAVRANPVWLPLLVIGAALVGIGAVLVLSLSHSCRGGGIPTAVVAIRGIISFKWIAGIFVLPFSALLTFIGGLPLGTEGPCVQMGTAIGDGVIKCFGAKKHKGWRRYIMTGGASAGFSIATSAPITAILFSMEELHKRFSPLLLTISSLSVMFAQIAVQILGALGIPTGGLFHLPQIGAISLKFLFVPLLVGVVCGACSALFTRLYHLIDHAMHRLLKKVPVKFVLPIIFAAVAAVGFFIPEVMGSGHSLVDALFDTQMVWYLLVLVFLLRAALMMISNTAGATGGVFLPTLAFGGLIGSLCAKGLMALGWIENDLYLLVVVLGITSFLGATSRIPITACVFAIEALGGINNVLAIIIATVTAYLVVEMSGLEDFTDSVIAAKVRSIKKGKTPTVVETTLTVKEGAFVIGKEVRDVLWPNACVVVSFERAQQNRGEVGIAEGDMITVYYKTYDPAATRKEFKILVGEQTEQEITLNQEESQFVSN